jgi:small GTP-binding protein
MKTSVPRIVMLGSTSVGKTSLINRIVSDKFDTTLPPTTGAGFFQYKSPEPNSREIQIWDTAGMERFRSLNSIYYHRAVGAILVFDLTNYESFQALESWRQEFVSKTNPNAVIVLSGNKNDKEDDFEVEQSDIDAYVNEHGLKFFRTSAQTGENVIELITTLVSLLPPSEVETTPIESENKGCC